MESVEGRLEFLNQQKLPVVIRPSTDEALLPLIEEGHEQLTAALRQYGAILFRGFTIKNPEAFREVAARFFGGISLPYVGGISPRGQVASGIYESTRYPAHLRIPQHNEMSYLPDPPRGLGFYCEVEPQHGGETPLADSRVIYRRMPAETMAALEKSGIRYFRNMYGPERNPISSALNKVVELHTSWMTAFSTDDRAVVERICAEQGCQVNWDWEGGARISNVLPPARKHPETGENLWFNQVSTFLASPQTVGTARWLLYHMVYPSPMRRPFHASLGDGEPIRLSQLKQINDAIDGATVRFRWQRGDVLLVDNYLVSHGRMPFRGDRRILVAIH